MGIVSSLKYQKKDTIGFNAAEFAKEIEATYLEESKAGFTQKKTFAPSTIGYGHGNCARYWYIAFNGADFEETATPQAKANMENGTYVHDRLQKRLSKTKRVIAHEVEITHDDPPIRGFMDSLIDWDGKEVAGEIKSVKSGTYAIREGQMAPANNHKIQLLTYMKIKGYDQGFFMYENKDDNTFIIIPIDMTPSNEKLIDGVFDWLRGAYKLYEEKTLPTRAAETRSKAPCNNCPVKNVCWKEMKNEIGDVDYPLLVI